MDETRLMVDTFPNSTNYLWVIASGPNEPYQGCVYIVSNDRSHRNILRLLSGDPEWCPDFAHGREFKLSVEIIVCDAFAGYDTAARLHNEEAGASQISLARCLQHANRLVIRSVDNMGLDKIYLKLTEEDFVKFSEKLEAYAKEYDLTQIDQNLAMIKDICFGKYTLIVSSLFGMKKELPMANKEMGLVNFFGSVPVILIDQRYEKALYKLGYGSIYTLLGTVIRCANPEKKFPTLLKKKDFLTRLLTKK